MFHLTGVGRGLFRGDAHQLKELGNGLVAAVYAAGNFHARGGEGDVPIPGHDNIAAFPQLLHGDADAGLGVSQLVHHIDGPDLAGLFLDDQDGLQVILRGFMYDQDDAPPFCLSLP